ncbi:MAG: sugar phosphate isomerase/epimerase [Clostridiales bacterium]|nr:sugar phosphate isomerase/epimerase [Clostridiales bacterium]
MSDYRDWKTAISIRDASWENLQRLHACQVAAIEILTKPDTWEQLCWQEIRQNTDATGIELWTVHLPFSAQVDISLPDVPARKQTLDMHKSIIKSAAGIGVKHFVLHPSSEPISDEERSLRMEMAKVSLRELADWADSLDAVICVEDLPRTCLGHTADEMLELLSVDDRLRVCFDVNHLLTIYGTTHEEFVKRLGSKIVTTHMSDYDFADEKHFFPGMGMLNWKALVEALEQADYRGPFLYEGGFSPSSWMPEIPYATYEEARERHLRIKELTGKNYCGK